MFVFRKEVDEVTLHATVVDDKNHIVTGLDRADFTVYEDGTAAKGHVFPSRRHSRGSWDSDRQFWLHARQAAGGKRSSH